MNDSTENFRNELEKVRRIADMLCTAHAVERATYRRWAAIVDILLIVISVYIVAMAFVDPALIPKLIPDQWNIVLWIGMLSIGTFILSILQIMVNWKARADAHHRSFCMYAEAKSKCIELLNANGMISREAYNGVRARYDMATDIGIYIEDARFLKLKQKHLLKVEISKILDKRPAAWVWYLHVCLWWRDTFNPSVEKQKK